MTLTHERDAIEAIHAPSPAPGFEDTIMLYVEAHLSWKERLLALFRPVCIRVRIDCEHAPGRTWPVSHVWAMRWRWPWQHRGAEVAQR